ncbi:MAG: GNAT family N-acetyltransferase, partial [Candidatus Levybacteria bacterium]|nr:GNAT family N-acetyltransferase [Candidatus Levybacteria bacterium]
RYPKKSDVKAMWAYINKLSKEQTFILFQREEIAFKDEEEYLGKMLEKIEKKKAVQLLVFSNNKLVGISEISMKDKAIAHEGVFGISVLEEYRGEGIGKKLMEQVLKEAKKSLPQLRIVTLGVFENNLSALKMYEKFSFREFGKLPEGILHKGKYIDHIYMYKKVKG